MRTSPTHLQRVQALRSPSHAPSLLRTDVRTATRRDVEQNHALGLLLQALDELQLIPLDGPNAPSPGQFHEAFVQMLHVAKALPPAVEETLLERMSHALRVHFVQRDRVAHALVSAWTRVVPREPAKLVVRIVDFLAADAAPLPYWLSHVLQLLPLSGPSPDPNEAQRQTRALLQARLDELAPDHMDKRLQRLEQDPDPRGLEQLVGDLGLLALEQAPIVGHAACDDHWLLTPLGHATLERVLHLCTYLDATTARRLRRQILYQYVHAARLPLLRPTRRHACLALPLIHRIVQTLDPASDPWADVLEWLAPLRSGHHGHPSSPSAQHTVFDLLLLPSFEQDPLLALRTLLDAQVDPAVWLPGVVRSCMATQPGLSRLLRPLQQLHASEAVHHALAAEVSRQCPPAHRMQIGFELGLLAFDGPSRTHGLTRDSLQALARAQTRYGAGWVPFGLLAHLLAEGKRFGCLGVGVAEGDWLLAFALENGRLLEPGMPAEALEEALKNLFDVLTHLGLAAERVAQDCMHLFDLWAVPPATGGPMPQPAAA